MALSLWSFALLKVAILRIKCQTQLVLILSASTPALIGCQFKMGQSGWIITCIAKVAACKVPLKTENAFNFQNLITEKGTQLALCHIVFTPYLHCLSFIPRIRSHVWKNFVVQNQTTAKCSVPLSATKQSDITATLQIYENILLIMPLNSLPTSCVHNCVN